MNSITCSIESLVSTLISYQTPLLITIELILLCFIYVYYKLHFWSRQGIPNHPWHFVESFTNQMNHADMNCVKKLGKIIGTYELLSPTLMIADRGLINEILVTRFKDFSDHRVWAIKGQQLGQCLFLLHYKEWKSSRALLSPTFSTGKIKAMKVIFNDATDILLANLEKVASTGQLIDICPYINSSVFDVVARACFACRVDTINDPNNEIARQAKLIFGKDKSITELLALLSPTLMKLFKIKAFNGGGVDFVAKLSEKNIKERKILNNAESNEGKHQDLVQYLLDANDKHNNKQKLTDLEVIDNCIMFYLAAFETTSIAIEHLIRNMAVNPDKQQLLIREIDEAFRGSTPDYENIVKLDYLNACVLESLRLDVSIVRIERVATRDCRLGPVWVPKGTYITIPIHAVHRDEDNFENPDEFQPERFLLSNKSQIKPGTFLSFADGPRNCIGQRFALLEIKLTICKLLQRYKFVACPQTMNLSYPKGQILSTPLSLMVKVEKRC